VEIRDGHRLSGAVRGVREPVESGIYYDCLDLCIESEPATTHNGTVFFRPTAANGRATVEELVITCHV
jgi:hypothetical protein